ncbi:transmembrane protein 35A [Galendromus occidentalis]|uniref:Novel acetylcholine receptor chaperone n=1 Tax=Galendromus occidentalis TaxID=34638 RepID=A0AAJ6QY87_9ACAR|nr:transmembrane protein 35A [Galendromus occidentalis]
MAKSVVLIWLSFFLGLFFIFIGSMKITPNINRDMHREIRRNFLSYSKVFPTNVLLNMKVSPKIFRLVIGWTEVCCGTTLLLIPGCIKQFANLCLLIVCTGAIYTHLMLWDPFERMAPSLFFTLLLLCRLVVYYQVKKRENIMEERRLLKAAREAEPQEVQLSAAKKTVAENREGSSQNEHPAGKKESRKNRRKIKKEE